MRYFGFQNETKDYLNRLSRETSVLVTPAGAKTLNDRVESLKKAGTWSQYSLGFNDTDGDAYLTRASVTDLIGRAEVLWFVRGMKALGLYSNMVAWPMRSYQNVGTGSTVRSLGGLGVYNGTLMNSPTWQVSGTRLLATSSQYMTTSCPNFTSPSIFCCYTPLEAITWDTPVGYGQYNTSISGTGLNRFGAMSLGNSGEVTLLTVNLSETAFLLGENVVGSHDYYTAKNGAALTVVTQSGNGSGSGGTFVVGRGMATGYSSGILAFAGVVRNMITNGQNAVLYTLYKSTLGSNLSLP